MASGVHFTVQENAVATSAHRKHTQVSVVRLRTLQDSLEALIVEARQLRDRVELFVAAQRAATRRILGAAHKRRRIPNLSRANRVF